MKKISLAAFAVAAFATQVASAAAGDMYVGIKGGYKLYSDKTLVDLYGQKSDSVNTPSDTATKSDIKLKGMISGGFVTPELGYMISDEFRGALQFSYNFDQKKVFENTSDNTAGAGAANVTAKPEQKLSGSWDVSGAFYYDFLNSSQFVPFIGLKIGFASRTYETTAIVAGDIGAGNTIDTATTAANKQTKKGMLFGVGLGVAYKVNDKVSLELAYTMERQPKAETKLTTGNIANGKLAPVFKAPKTAHNIGAGVRFAF